MSLVLQNKAENRTSFPAEPEFGLKNHGWNTLYLVECTNIISHLINLLPKIYEEKWFDHKMNSSETTHQWDFFVAWLEEMEVSYGSTMRVSVREEPSNDTVMRHHVQNVIDNLATDWQPISPGTLGNLFQWMWLWRIARQHTSRL